MLEYRMVDDCKTVYVSILTVGGATADEVIQRWAQPADRAYAGKHRLPAGQRRSLLARALLRDLLQHTSNLTGTEWEIGTDTRGRPWVSHPCLRQGVAVSITHSGEYVAVAVTRLGAIGIDIERHETARRFSEIAETAFGPSFAYLDEAVPFYRLWCLREATGKAVGEGLASVLDLEELTHDTPAVGAWCRRDASGQWLLAHLEPVPGYSLGIGVLPGNGVPLAGWSLESLSWHRLPDKAVG